MNENYRKDEKKQQNQRKIKNKEHIHQKNTK